MTDDTFLAELRSLAGAVAAVADWLRTAESRTPELQAVAPEHLPSARNLIHYLALRRHDIRGLQDRLARVGLSSLGRAEPCVAATLENVRALLALACGAAAPARDPSLVTLADGRRRLARSTEALLGAADGSRRCRIMVTLPSEAADDAALVRELVRRGMDGARINCAHDDAPAWARMIAHVRAAAAEARRAVQRPHGSRRAQAAHRRARAGPARSSSSSRRGTGSAASPRRRAPGSATAAPRRGRGCARRRPGVAVAPARRHARDADRRSSEARARRRRHARGRRLRRDARARPT